jgi:hypothetical protein
MASLHYMSRRGAGVAHHGTVLELVERMKRLRVDAVLRDRAGEVIGAVEECDGSCDDPNCRWHWWAELETEAQ